MNNIEMEEKLLRHGFTGKDILKLRIFSSKYNESYDSLLLDLRRRFVASCIFFVIFFSFIGYEFFSTDTRNYIPLTITSLFVLIAGYILTPLNLSFKAFSFLRKS